MSLRELIVELIAWAPLIALLLSSLGLIILKRISGLPPWAQRLAVPPFYFVSLPIATLTIGMKVLVLYGYAVWQLSHIFFDRLSTLFCLLLSLCFGFWLPFSFCCLAPFPITLFLAGFTTAGVLGLIMNATPDERLVVVAFCAAQLVSGHLLWRTLWRDDAREYLSNKSMQHVRALLLLFAFAWTFSLPIR